MRKLTLATLTAFGLFAASPLLAQTPQPATGNTKPATSAPAKPMATPAAREDLLDINSASQDQLEALKGVGKVRAEAIIKGRPYKGKDELMQKKIIPENVYKDIKDKIIARQKAA